MMMYTVTVEGESMERWLSVTTHTADEWFHFDCVNLTVAPRGKWFCSDCNDLMLSCINLLYNYVNKVIIIIHFNEINHH